MPQEATTCTSGGVNMDRFFLFLVLHNDDPATQEDCQCPKDRIPGLQSLVKDLVSFHDEIENSSTDVDSVHSMLFDPLLALKTWVPTIRFSLVEDKPLSNQFECYSRWHTGEHLKEVLSLLEKPVSPRKQNHVELSSDNGAEISERLHQLADGLPDQVIEAQKLEVCIHKQNCTVEKLSEIQFTVKVHE